MLETEALVIKYGPFLALDGVDISVGDGEIVGVIGANGAGKSSLVRAIAGLVPAASGRVAFKGRALGAGPGCRRQAAVVRNTIQANKAMAASTIREPTIARTPVPPLCFARK